MTKEDIRARLIKNGCEPTDDLVNGWFKIVNGIIPPEFLAEAQKAAAFREKRRGLA